MVDLSARELLMKHLVRNIKGNQDMFLNNRLDDLLQRFGDRKCKSMIELGTGWDKVDDPRNLVTWPLAPGEREELEGNYRFTARDMIGEHHDNVYAEAKLPERKYEVAVQGDLGQKEFMN